MSDTEHTPDEPFIMLAGETGSQGAELRLYPDGAIVVLSPEWGTERNEGIEFRPDEQAMYSLMSVVTRGTRPQPGEAEALAQHIEAQRALADAAT